MFDYATTLEYLAYFGYLINDNENQCTAVQGNVCVFTSVSVLNSCELIRLIMGTVTREKKSDILKKQSMRNVYVCHVIGEKGSGKSTLCQTHIGNNLKVCNLIFSLLVPMAVWYSATYRY